MHPKVWLDARNKILVTQMMIAMRPQVQLAFIKGQHSPNMICLFFSISHHGDWTVKAKFKISIKSGTTQPSRIQFRLGPLCAKLDTQYHLKHRLGQQSDKLVWLSRDSELARLNHLSWHGWIIWVDMVESSQLTRLNHQSYHNIPELNLAIIFFFLPNHNKKKQTTTKTKKFLKNQRFSSKGKVFQQLWLYPWRKRRK